MPRPCIETPCPGMDSRSSPRQDPGIGLVFGDRARDQACPPHPAAHSALFRADSPHFTNCCGQRLHAALGPSPQIQQPGGLAGGRPDPSLRDDRLWHCTVVAASRPARCCTARGEPPEPAEWGLALVGFNLTQPRASPGFRTREQRQSQTNDAQHKPYQRGERDGAFWPTSGLILAD